MPKPRVNLAVGNAGVYRSIGSLPDINQPDTLSVEKYMGAPFYAYMYLTTKKQEEVRAESIADLLSKEEAVNYYVERMGRDLKLQKAAMGATLLRTTYVHIKEMRKFLWQHNNTEKVIARDDHGYLPAFKRMLTRFVLLNYCAMNTPGVSGAEWVPEKHEKSSFDAVDAQYKAEFKYFSWKGENCKLRHPNPLNGHPKVNFSAYTDDTSNGRVFVMDVAKHDLVNEINTVNAQIFELLSSYIGSLSKAPTYDQLEAEGIHYTVKTPEVFESISAQKTIPDVYLDDADKPHAPEALIGQAIQLRTEAAKKAASVRNTARLAEESARAGEVSRLASESARLATAAADKALRGDAKKAAQAAADAAKEAYDAVKGSQSSSSSSSAPPAPDLPKIERPTLAEAAAELGVTKKDSPEFMKQAEALEGGLAKAAALTYVGSLNREAVNEALERVFEGSGIASDSISERVRVLAAALHHTKYFGTEEQAAVAAIDIIAKGLAQYTRDGKTLKSKTTKFVAFNKDGGLRKIGSDNKVGQATKIVAQMFTRGKFDYNKALGMI